MGYVVYVDSIPARNTVIIASYSASSKVSFTDSFFFFSVSRARLVKPFLWIEALLVNILSCTTHVGGSSLNIRVQISLGRNTKYFQCSLPCHANVPLILISLREFLLLFTFCDHVLSFCLYSFLVIFLFFLVPIHNSRLYWIVVWSRSRCVCRYTHIFIACVIRKSPLS